MELSIRMKAVAEMALEAERLADIGTDHGYVPIYLARQGKLKSALAMDVNRGPLERAKENIRRYGLEEMIQTRLSDGAANLQSGEADTVVIAGMGGALTMRILLEGSAVLETVDTLVLQPQSELMQVRKFLHRQGYAIAAENMVKDEGKYYPMMKAVHEKQERWQEYEYRFGKFLIREKNLCLAEFLEKEEKTCLQILGGLEGKEGSHIQRRREEVEKALLDVKQARKDLTAQP